MSEDRIRLLHVVGTARAGGVETFVLNLARYLDPRRFALSVLVLGPDGPLKGYLQEAGASVHFISAHHSFTPATAFAYLRLLRAGNFDIVHSNVGSRATRYLARLVGARAVISHLHGPPDDWVDGLRRGDAQTGKYLNRLAFAGADQVVVFSGWLKERITRVCPDVADRLRVVRYGVESDQSASRDGRPSLRRELGLRESELVVGFVGRLVQQKGIPHLIGVAERLLATHRNLRFVIVGDGPLRPELERATARLGPSNFILLGERWDVLQCMQLFDLLVLPSEWESLGIVALEAMAAAKPVVAFAVDGIPEAILDGVTGLLVRPGDVVGLADAASTLLADRGRCEAMGSAARLRVQQYFDVHRMVGEIESLYQQVLSTPGR